MYRVCHLTRTSTEQHLLNYALNPDELFEIRQNKKQAF